MKKLQYINSLFQQDESIGVIHKGTHWARQ